MNIALGTFGFGLRLGCGAAWPESCDGTPVLCTGRNARPAIGCCASCTWHRRTRGSSGRLSWRQLAQRVIISAQAPAAHDVRTEYFVESHYSKSMSLIEFGIDAFLRCLKH